MRILALAIAAYLIGSLPSAFVVVRLSRGTDLRAVESGSVGALNAFRATGAGWIGVVVLHPRHRQGDARRRAGGRRRRAPDPRAGHRPRRRRPQLADLAGRQGRQGARHGGGSAHAGHPAQRAAVGRALGPGVRRLRLHRLRNDRRDRAPAAWRSASSPGGPTASRPCRRPSSSWPATARRCGASCSAPSPNTTGVAGRNLLPFLALLNSEWNWDDRHRSP